MHLIAMSPGHHSSTFLHPSSTASPHLSCFMHTTSLLSYESLQHDLQLSTLITLIRGELETTQPSHFSVRDMLRTTQSSHLTDKDVLELTEPFPILN